MKINNKFKFRFFMEICCKCKSYVQFDAYKLSCMICEWEDYSNILINNLKISTNEPILSQTCK